MPSWACADLPGTSKCQFLDPSGSWWDLTSLPPCRYRKFSIAEDVDLVVRCEVDGVMTYKGEDQLLSIKALNEFDSKTTGELAASCSSNNWAVTSSTCQHAPTLDSDGHIVV